MLKRAPDLSANLIFYLRSGKDAAKLTLGRNSCFFWNLSAPQADIADDTGISAEANLDKNEIYCELLVLRCQRGDSRAFRELVRLFEKRILYYLRRLTDNEQEAWDILQQTWLKVLRGIHSLREPRKFKSWLYTVARFSAANSLRARLRDNLEPDDSALENIPDTENDPDAFANADLVHFGLGKLPLGQREILTLFFLEGFPLAEISEILETPEGTVKSRLHRAKQALRIILVREGGQK